MRFGLYLKNKRVITAEQLVSAMEVQTNKLVPIGQLALEEGLLCVRDIFAVLRAQEDSPSLRFGDLAVEMGLMTRDDVVRLLMIQADRKRSIAEILVAQGMLTADEVERELAAYRQSLLNPQRATTTTVPASCIKTADRNTAKALAAV